MSVVSGVVICMSLAEGTTEDTSDLVNQIDEWLNAHPMIHSCNHHFEYVQDAFGSSKHPQMFVVGADINSLPEREFVEFVMDLPWQEPSNVVLVINPEDGPTRVFRPTRVSGASQ